MNTTDKPTDKLYGDIEIEVRPYQGLFAKWCARTVGLVEKPYNREYAKIVEAYGKTSEEALSRLKKRLCMITTREEERHAEHLEWKAGIKTATFSREQDCQ